jgi:hypothetical protein
MELLYLTLNQPTNNHREPQFLNLSKIEDMNFADCQLAADQGIPEAQIALGEMYSTGKELDKDPISAYMWYLISEQTTLELKNKISSAKRTLAEQLTTEEILEAQQRASERLKTNAKSTLSTSRVTSVGAPS